MKRYKYPRTFHLPFDSNYTSDDKVLKSTKHFYGKEVVITEKMDGENCTMYRDYIHARSIDSTYHPSRSWVKNFHGMIRHSIDFNHRICGENLFAKHAILYEELLSYFYAFSIWNCDICLSVKETIDILNNLGVYYVPVIYSGIYSDDVVKEIISKLDVDKQEGIVVRLASAFHILEFSTSVAKWVRSGHVDNNDDHWMYKEIVKNILKSEK